MKILALLFAICFTISCQSQTTPTEQGVNLSSCSQFADQIEQNTNIQLIDVRTPQEYAGGTISNRDEVKAVNIDFLSDDFEQKLNTLDKQKPILIFCAKGGRSAQAAVKAKELGFETIYDLDGGYGAWQQQSK